MFGLFRTEKNPKGPSLKRLQNLCFDFVDSKLSLKLPYGNHRILENNSNVEQSINIYDVDLYDSSELEFPYFSKTVLNVGAALK